MAALHPQLPPTIVRHSQTKSHVTCQSWQPRSERIETVTRAKAGSGKGPYRVGPIGTNGGGVNGFKEAGDPVSWCPVEAGEAQGFVVEVVRSSVDDTRCPEK